MTGTERVTVSTSADAIRRVRTSGAEHVLLLLPPDLDPMEAALARSALGPLAIGRAPDRVNALAAAEGSDPATAEKAACFLEGARSTTGQVLELR